MAGSYLLDTTVVIPLLRREPWAIARLHDTIRFAINTVVLGELVYGASHSRWPEKNLLEIRRFLQKCPVLGSDQETAELFGSLKAHQRRLGKLIPDHDLWIVATAKQFGLTLATLDGHFSSVPDLNLEFWGAEPPHLNRSV